MFRITISAVALLLAASSVVAASVLVEPPVAIVKPVQDNYFGTVLTDPYRWMENLKDPAVQAWIKGQADYANATLAKIPGREAFLARIQSLDNLTDSYGGISRDGPYVFYEKRPLHENNFKLYMRRGLDGPQRLLVDPVLLTKDGVHSSLDYFVPSPDGKYVVYGISPGGSEDDTTHILVTATGKILPDTITRTWMSENEIGWLPDCHSFTYNRMQLLSPGQNSADKESDSKAYLHVIGTDPDTQDVPLLGKNMNALIPFEDIDIPYLLTSPGAPTKIFALNDRGVKNENAIWVAPIESLSIGASRIPWKKVCDFDDDVTDWAAQNGKIYLLSHKYASHFKVVCESADAPSFDHAKLIVPPGKTVITGINAASDALYVHGRDGAVGFLTRVTYSNSAAKPISLPFIGALNPGIVADPRLPGCIFATESGTHIGAWYRYDPLTSSSTRIAFQRNAHVDLSGIEQIETFATATDGTKIPLSILCPKNMKLDGSHPTVLQGYGSYGISQNMGFSPSFIAWVELGGVAAIAHVRGGGEEGEDWYRGGYKATKPNTWNDFIACGQYLVDKKYTSPAKLGCIGGSAGGILISRAITERPGLWRAAIIVSGTCDAIRSELTPNGPDNIPEFGTATTPDGFKNLFAMDGYQHVKDGVHYPAVLLTTGINDPRVAPWELAKMTARLQAVLPPDERLPVLLRVDYDAGHGMGSTVQQRDQTRADQFAFLLWQFGQPGFQPAN